MIYTTVNYKKIPPANDLLNQSFIQLLIKLYWFAALIFEEGSYPDPTIADAIMDRVIHNAYILALDSKISMREVMAQRIIKNLSCYEE